MELIFWSKNSKGKIILLGYDNLRGGSQNTLKELQKSKVNLLYLSLPSNCWIINLFNVLCYVHGFELFEYFINILNQFSVKQTILAKCLHSMINLVICKHGLHILCLETMLGSCYLLKILLCTKSCSCLNIHTL